MVNEPISENKNIALNDHVCEIGDIVGSIVRVLGGLTGADQNSDDKAEVVPAGALTLLEVRMVALECQARSALGLAEEVRKRIE